MLRIKGENDLSSNKYTNNSNNHIVYKVERDS